MKIKTLWSAHDAAVWEAIYGDGTVKPADVKALGCTWDAEWIGLTGIVALSAALSCAAYDYRRIKRNRSIGYHPAPKWWRERR